MASKTGLNRNLGGWTCFLVDLYRIMLMFWKTVFWILDNIVVVYYPWGSWVIWVGAKISVQLVIYMHQTKTLSPSAEQGGPRLQKHFGEGHMRMLYFIVSGQAFPQNTKLLAWSLGDINYFFEKEICLWSLKAAASNLIIKWIWHIPPEVVFHARFESGRTAICDGIINRPLMLPWCPSIVKSKILFPSTSWHFSKV